MSNGSWIRLSPLPLAAAVYCMGFGSAAAAQDAGTPPAEIAPTADPGAPPAAAEPTPPPEAATTPTPTPPHVESAPAPAEPALAPEAPAASSGNAIVAGAPAEPEDAAELGSVIVTGNRSGQARTVADSPSPIDVIGHQEIQNTGRVGLKEILGAIVPAMNMPAQGGGGTSASLRPYTYRGLSGDYLLVLINGKRRHTTSLINNLSRVSGGSTPVDLDLIPASAISRVEILRDGAAAQYGSDAVSGVLNIILDESAQGLNFSETAGQTYSHHGPLLQQTLSWGTPLGDRGGFLRLSAEAKYRDAADSSAQPIPAKKADGSPNPFYVPLSADEEDPRERNVDGKVTSGGYGRSNRDLVLNTAYNAELPIADAFKLYSFSTLSHRNIKDRRGAFTANTIASLPELYPNGFQAYRRIWEWDGQATVGGKGDVAAWQWDLSSSYGRDYVRLGAENTLNPSLGPGSKTSFFMGKQIQDLWVNNLDISKGFPIGLAEPLALALGVEHRWEKFQNKAGEPDSYRDGGFVIPDGADPWHRPKADGGFGGQTPSPGLVSFTGTSRVDARALDRHNVAGYADLSTKPIKNWFVGVAGRAEHYTDSAGNTVSGKLVSRYELLPGLAVRGGINSGFRAPSLAQTGFSTTQNTATIIGAERVTTTSKFLPVDSKAAIALGAEPLRPEKSLSYTAGVTLELARAFRLTIDGYITHIDDRIVKTDFLGTTANGGPAVRDLLATNGVDNVDTAQFFTNAIDTITRGVDIVAEYTLKHDDLGTFRPSAALSVAKSVIDHVNPNPRALADLNVVRFGRQSQLDLIHGAPNSKIILGANWAIWRFRTDLRFTRWGEYTESSTDAKFDQKFGAKWVTDLDIGYSLSDNVTLAVGAYNLFDVYPDKHGIVNVTDGSGQYGSFAPFGLTGGFYYARLSVNL
jgi:iron complex outermembrane receptor protein